VWLTSLRPEMKAQVCPVCNGSGKYFVPLTASSQAVGSQVTCHGCEGKGWVEVSGDEPRVIRYYYPSYPSYGGWYDQYGIWHQGY